MSLPYKIKYIYIYNFVPAKKYGESFTIGIKNLNLSKLVVILG